MAAAVC